MSNDVQFDETQELLLFTSKSKFFEGISTMPYVERCIFLGRVTGVGKKEIKKVLHITEDEYTKIVPPVKEAQWRYFIKIL